jgi:hypothetical protein
MSEEVLKNYGKFVEGVTSDASNNHTDFIQRANALAADVNVPLLLTGAIGMCDEGGEFAGLVKKIVFHGKNIDDEVRLHLEKELGDVLWYWINSCRALGIDPYSAIEKNVEVIYSLSWW